MPRKIKDYEQPTRNGREYVTYVDREARVITSLFLRLGLRLCSFSFSFFIFVLRLHHLTFRAIFHSTVFTIVVSHAAQRAGPVERATKRVQLLRGSSVFDRAQIDRT